MNRSSLIAAIAAGLLLAGCGTNGSAQSAAAPSSPALHRCRPPAEQALARPDGTVVGRVGPDGAVTVGTVWLEIRVDNTPVYDETGKFANVLLALGQPPVELLACQGGRIRIRFPMCDEEGEGEIDAFDPRTGEPTVRIAPTAASPGGC